MKNYLDVGVLSSIIPFQGEEPHATSPLKTVYMCLRKQSLTFSYILECHNGKPKKRTTYNSNRPWFIANEIVRRNHILKEKLSPHLENPIQSPPAMETIFVFSTKRETTITSRGKLCLRLRRWQLCTSNYDSDEPDNKH